MLTSETKTTSDPNKISKEMFPTFQTSCWKISVQFYVINPEFS